MADLERNAKLKLELFTRNIRQVELAKSLGIAPGILSQIISGRTVPFDHEKKQIAKILNKRVEELFD